MTLDTYKASTQPRPWPIFRIQRSESRHAGFAPVFRENAGGSAETVIGRCRTTGDRKNKWPDRRQLPTRFRRFSGIFVWRHVCPSAGHVHPSSACSSSSRIRPIFAAPERRAARGSKAVTLVKAIEPGARLGSWGLDVCLSWASHIVWGDDDERIVWGDSTAGGGN